MKILRYIMLCSLLWALQGSPFAYAAIPLTVEVNKSLVLDLSPITKLAVANPEIADVYLSGEQLLVIGKKSGVTSLQIWQAGRLLELTVSKRVRAASPPLDPLILRQNSWARPAKLAAIGNFIQK